MSWFVTATGTDIGKTYVTAGLVRRARLAGKTVAALKPIASGFDMTRAEESDAGQLLEALGEPVTPESIARICPWRFSEPLSPDMAAARENRAIDFAALIAFCRAAIEANATLFIEGVGGVMVPLDAKHTVLDWMAALGLPVVLVTGSYLGTLSHTLTAIDVCGRRGLKLAAVVVNESGQGAPPLTETVATLERFNPGTRVISLARNAGDFSTVGEAII